MLPDGGIGNSSSTASSLLQGLRRRDADAWRRLARLYGPLVYSWCRRHSLQVKDAEDVVQEVFMTVAARIRDFHRDRPGDTFRGWLWTITRHKLGDWLRRQKTKEKLLGAADKHEARVEQVLAEEPSEDLGQLTRQALAVIQAEFEDHSWQAFWRVVVEEQLPGDVAIDLGMSRNAVYIARSRVLRRLREVLGDEE